MRDYVLKSDRNECARHLLMANEELIGATSNDQMNWNQSHPPPPSVHAIFLRRKFSTPHPLSHSPPVQCSWDWRFWVWFRNWKFHIPLSVWRQISNFIGTSVFILHPLTCTSIDRITARWRSCDLPELLFDTEGDLRSGKRSLHPSLSRMNFYLKTMNASQWPAYMWAVSPLVSSVNESRLLMCRAFWF